MLTGLYKTGRQADHLYIPAPRIAARPPYQHHRSTASAAHSAYNTDVKG